MASKARRYSNPTTLCTCNAELHLARRGITHLADMEAFESLEVRPNGGGSEEYIAFVLTETRDAVYIDFTACTCQFIRVIQFAVKKRKKGKMLWVKPLLDT